jgi:hypothetical protein
MPNKFNRTNFMEQNLIDDVIENDLARTHFGDFSFKKPRIFYTVTEEDLYRPDIISLKNLGKQDYWWIIMKVNNIDDIYNDMFLGQSLQIPSIEDIEDFYVRTRRKIDL